MKNKILLTSLLCLLFSTSFAQKSTKDYRSQTQKEDGNNKWRSEDINQLDMLHALSINGIRIHKFKIGDFDKAYQFDMIIDEYLNGNLVKTDTILSETNEYSEMNKGEKGYMTHFIDQIKVISQDDDNKSKLKIFTYLLESRSIEIICKKDKKDQFYSWRNYADVAWKLNQKIPLMIFASSWEDKQYKFQRFCGVVNLEENEKQTLELLNSSPQYYKISYAINEMKK
jgi:hypothetical protein